MPGFASSSGVVSPLITKMEVTFCPRGHSNVRVQPVSHHCQLLGLAAGLRQHVSQSVRGGLAEKLCTPVEAFTRAAMEPQSGMKPPSTGQFQSGLTPHTGRPARIRSQATPQVFIGEGSVEPQDDQVRLPVIGVNPALRKSSLQEGVPTTQHRAPGWRSFSHSKITPLEISIFSGGTGMPMRESFSK